MNLANFILWPLFQIEIGYYGRLRNDNRRTPYHRSENQVKLHRKNIKISVNIAGNLNRTTNLTGPPPCMDPPLQVSEEYLVRSGISFLIFCAAIVGNIFVLYPLIRNFKRQRFEIVTSWWWWLKVGDDFWMLVTFLHVVARRHQHQSNRIEIRKKNACL